MKHTLWLLVALFVASPALADEAPEPITETEDANPWEINLSVAPLNQHIGDPSFDLVSGNDWLSSVVLTLEFELIDDLFIAPAYFYGSSTAQLHKRDDAKLAIEGWELKVRKGFQVLSWLRPYALVAGTYNWYSLDITRSYGSKLTQEDGFLAGRLGGRGGLGAEFMIPRSVMASTGIGEWLGDFTLGLGFEAGYSYRPTFNLDGLSPSAPYGAAENVPTSNLDVGDMDLSGWYWSLDFRFLF